VVAERSELVRIYGASTGFWSSSGRHEVHDEWWLALSGGRNANFNLACCQSASTASFRQNCLDPVMDLGQPSIIMLTGGGLTQVNTLEDLGWIPVGSLPLMLSSSHSWTYEDASDVREIRADEIEEARSILQAAFGLDETSALTALPTSILDERDVATWGLFDGRQLIACAIIVKQNGLSVVWSMATRPADQKRGFGRRLLRSVLFDDREGVDGSLLSASKAGEGLYRNLGYQEIDSLRLWSRPRWVLGA